MRATRFSLGERWRGREGRGSVNDQSNMCVFVMFVVCDVIINGKWMGATVA
jgi:hypothetical protein